MNSCGGGGGDDDEHEEEEEDKTLGVGNLVVWMDSQIMGIIIHRFTDSRRKQSEGTITGIERKCDDGRPKEKKKEISRGAALSL